MLCSFLSFFCDEKRKKWTKERKTRRCLDEKPSSMAVNFPPRELRIFGRALARNLEQNHASATSRIIQERSAQTHSAIMLRTSLLSDLFGAIQWGCISLSELTVWTILLTLKNIRKIVSLSDWCEILTDMWLRRIRSESFFGYRFFAVKEMVQLCSKPYKLYILYIFISIRYLTLISIMYKHSWYITSNRIFC